VRKRTVRLLLLAGLVAGAAAGLAGAAAIDRVVVGVTGRNATVGFSAGLYVEVMVESGYHKTSFDGDHGVWVGPPYHSTKNASLGGKAGADWTVYFDKGLTVKQAQAKHFVQHWARLQAASIDVPHVVGQTRVAKIRGTWLLTKGPGDTNSQFEGVLTFPLCRGVVVSAEFAFLTPFSVSDNTGGQYRVYASPGDKDPVSWNYGAAVLAPAEVALLGYLPAAQIGPVSMLKPAGSATHAVAGRVLDCSGAPMPSVPVRVGNTTAHADERGIFQVHVPSAGDYPVTVTAGGGTVRKTLHAG